MMKIVQFYLGFLLILLLAACGGETTTTTSTPDTPANSVTAPTETTSPETAAETRTYKALFFGNSLTAGYGVDADKNWVSLLENRLDSLGHNFEIINAGVSGETSAGGLERIDWVMDQHKPIDLFVLELGANDGLRGLDQKTTYNNLEGILVKVFAKSPNARIIVIGMKAPPNMGKEYTDKFESMFFELAAANSVDYVPFLLEGVAGNPDLNIADGIHPNPEGHKIVLENVWATIQTYADGKFFQ